MIVQPAQGPSWVKSGPWRVLERCALYPDEQKSARARANENKLGRHRVDPAVEARILELKASGDGIFKIGKSRRPSFVLRIQNKPMAVDHLAVLCDRHVDARAAF